MEAAVIAALFVFGGLFTYTIGERRHRRRWWIIERRADPELGSPYRLADGPSPTRPVLGRSRAPQMIRRTALWSIYMGQMALPGGLLGLFGTLFMGIGLLSIPGMILAVRIWRLGYALLRHDAGAAVEARLLTGFARRLNLVGVFVGIVALMLGGWPLSLVLWGYGAVSFAHASAMERCAELLEAEARVRRDLAWRPAPDSAMVG